MDGDKFDLLGPAFERIGEEAMRLIGGAPDGVYLYVEIGDGWVGPSLFHDDGSYVRYVDASHSALCELISDAWYLEPPDKRWTAMHYVISGGKFDAKLDFDDLENSDEDLHDRRERVLRERYGDKPIVYPPLPGWPYDLESS